MNKEENCRESGITIPYYVIKIDDNKATACSVEVCREETVALYVNGTLLVRLSLSPADLEPFAIGHLICEGWIKSGTEISHITLGKDRLDLTIPNLKEENLCSRKELYSSGYPGKSQSWKEEDLPMNNMHKILPEIIFTVAKLVNEKAEVWTVTGGTHCTVITDLHGNLLTYAEDMGRHTSVDKAVGKAIISGINPEECIMACSGRMPADMVAKGYRAGFPIIISHNAPFTEGINLARRLHVTLAGFVRPPRMTLYSIPERIDISW